MSKYRFNISDYHAIENADILVDGITVLAGPNGSGKSTISKWLYYMVDVATRFDEYVGKGVNDEFKHSLQAVLRAHARKGSLPRPRKAPFRCNHVRRSARRRAAERLRPL